MPTPAHQKQFIKAFESLAHHRERHHVLADFLEMVVCAISKTILPPGPTAILRVKLGATLRRRLVDDSRAATERFRWAMRATRIAPRRNVLPRARCVGPRVP